MLLPCKCLSSYGFPGYQLIYSVMNDMALYMFVGRGAEQRANNTTVLSYMVP